ncbi:MAG: DUF47 family protein [Christensenellaceae bacterium]|nr:DUF47 family protein [Christensenellaceae bacterium]
MAKGNRYDYFSTMEEMSSISFQSSLILQKIAKEFDFAKIQEYMSEIHELEHKEDNIKHELTEHLMKEFLPPIEREDIRELSARLDDVTDGLDELLHQFYIMDIEHMTDDCIEFIDLLVKCCRHMDLAIKELRNFRKSDTLKAHIIQVNNVESIGDTLYTNILHKMYTTPDLSAVDLIKWNKIFEIAENICDACENVAECIETIIMKNI